MVFFMTVGRDQLCRRSWCLISDTGALCGYKRQASRLQEQIAVENSPQLPQTLFFSLCSSVLINFAKQFRCRSICLPIS